MDVLLHGPGGRRWIRAFVEPQITQRALKGSGSWPDATKLGLLSIS